MSEQPNNPDRPTAKAKAAKSSTKAKQRKTQSTVEKDPSQVRSPNEQSTIDILKGLRSGEIKPELIDQETRHICIQHLRGEGLTNAEIARLFDCCDRTVIRDRAAIAKANALRVDPGFADRIAGGLLYEVENAITRIKRAVRDPAATPADRIHAEKVCIDIQCGVIERLQSMGYLPNATTRAEVSIRSDDLLPSAADLAQEARALMALVKAHPELADAAPGLRQAFALSQQAHAVEIVADVKQRVAEQDVSALNKANITETQGGKP